MTGAGWAIAVAGWSTTQGRNVTSHYIAAIADQAAALSAVRAVIGAGQTASPVAAVAANHLQLKAMAAGAVRRLGRTKPIKLVSAVPTFFDRP
jgi:hypothetical protein